MTTIAPNVTIRCIGCNKEIWQDAEGYTTLDEMRTAKCSDCYLAATLALRKQLREQETSCTRTTSD